MKTRLTAEEAIEKIKSSKTEIFGHMVQKYNYTFEIRKELQNMAERNEISPAEYNKALKITHAQMTESDKAIEKESLR